jgi:hypothetical protein
MEEEAQWFQGVAKVLRPECMSLHIPFRAETLTSLSLFRRPCSQPMQVLSLHAASFTRKQQICGNGPGSIGQIRIFVCTLIEQLYNYATREAVRYSEVASNERTYKQRLLFLIFALPMAAQNQIQHLEAEMKSAFELFETLLVGLLRQGRAVEVEVYVVLKTLLDAGRVDTGLQEVVHSVTDNVWMDPGGNMLDRTLWSKSEWAPLLKSLRHLSTGLLLISDG